MRPRSRRDDVVRTIACVRQVKPRLSLQYAHVESAIRRDRREEDDNRVARAERRADEQAERASAAESRAEAAHEERAKLQQLMEVSDLARRAAEEQLEVAHERMASAEEKYLLAKEEATREATARAEEREISDALGARSIERWPMLQNKKVLRVLDAEEFDGRVSSEYRVKDEESGDKGVSLLMGRTAATGRTEAQCILFDARMYSDLEVARWWARNGARFERAAQQHAAFAKMARKNARSPCSPAALRMR